MHETSLAKQILDVVLERAERAGGGSIVAVRGWIAETEHLEPDSLAFHFAAHARGTAAEGARLELDLRHIRATCASCAETYLPEHHLLLCPKCGSTDAELSGEPGMAIEAIDLEQPSS